MRAGDWQRRLKEWQERGELPALLPEVAALGGVLQPEDYHGEGDALIHTLLAVAALNPGADERVFWGVLLHDLGKASTTHYQDGRWRAHGHSEAGEALARAVLVRLGLNHLLEDVCWLVRHHHFALSWNLPTNGTLTRRQQRFCRLPLFPLLAQVCRADAAASAGISRKKDRLEQIVLLADPENQP